jgi:hypothetical protein
VVGSCGKGNGCELAGLLNPPGAGRGRRRTADRDNEGEEVREVGPRAGEAGSREDGRRSVHAAASSSRRRAWCVAAWSSSRGACGGEAEDAPLLEQREREGDGGGTWEGAVGWVKKW